MKRLLSFIILFLLAGSLQTVSAETTLGTAITSVPYKISQPGIYILTGPLSATLDSGAAITIASSGVVLDLNGNTLSNQAPSGLLNTTSVGIQAVDCSNLTIRNGTVTGFLVGVQVTASDTFPGQATATGNLIQDIRAFGNTQYGFALTGAASQIRHCQAEQTGGSLQADTFGFYAKGSALSFLDNDATQVATSGPALTYGFYLDGGSADTFLVKNRVTGATFGFYYAPGASGKYRRNLAGQSVVLGFLGGTDAGYNIIDSNGNGIDDDWEIRYFGSLISNPNALAPANDGYTILEEYQLGRNPTSTTPGPIGPPPFPATGLCLWLRADEGIFQTSGNSVNVWHDWSGTDNQATQSVSGQQPTLAAGMLNGLPTVHFAPNSSQFLNVSPAVGSALNNANAGEMFVVLKANANPSSGSKGFVHFGNGQGIYAAQYPSGNNEIYDDFGCTAQQEVGYPPVPITQFNVYDAASTSNEWKVRINGLVQSATSTNTPSFASAPTIGLSGGDYFEGDIAEILIFSQELSSSSREAVEEYLASKYALGPANPPAAPAYLLGTALSPNQTSISWTYDLGKYSTHFNIQRKVGASGTYSNLTTVDNATSYIDTTVAAGTEYWYRVSTTSFAGATSAYSNEARAITPATGNPFPMNGMRLWLKADAGVTNPLISWADQSGNGVILAQPKADTQPALVDNSVHGKQTVHFSAGPGLSQVLTLPAGLMNGVTSGAERFVVLKVTDADLIGTAVGFMQFGNLNNGYSSYPDGQENINDDFGTGTQQVVGHPAQSLSMFHVYDSISQPGQWQAIVAGQIQYTNYTNTVQFGANLKIGMSGPNYFQGDFAEIIVYDHALSAADRVSVNQYLTAKYFFLDSDGDGLDDLFKLESGLNPYNADPNGYGITDAQALQLGLNPTVPNTLLISPFPPPPQSPPNLGDHTPPVITLTLPANAILL